MAIALPADKQAELNKYKHISYVDPSTGKMTYIDSIGPEGGTLSNMDLTNPAGIDNTPKANDTQSMVDALLRGFAPSNKTASAPISSNLYGTYANLLKGAPNTGEQNFQDYIGRIGAPSSVDEVQKGLDTQGVQQLLEQIDRDTNQSLSSTKLDFLDRGIAGPGQTSDIESNALAQVRTGAGRTKAAAQLDAYRAELARQKAREDAVNSAYGKRYEVGANADTQMRNNLASLLGSEFTGNITQSEGAKSRASAENMNYMNQLLDYAVKTGQMSQQDAQFYAKLVSDENTAGANREAAYQNALLANRSDQPDFFTGLGQSALTGITSGLIGGVTSGLTNLIPTPKKKVKTAGVE